MVAADGAGYEDELLNKSEVRRNLLVKYAIFCCINLR